MTDFEAAHTWDSAIYYGKKVHDKMSTKFGELSFFNAEMIVELGYIYDEAGDLINSNACFKSANAVFKSIKDTGWVYRESLIDFGITCNRMGAYTEAQASLLQCAELSKKNGDMVAFNQCMIILAIIYEQFGEYSKTALLYHDIQKGIDTLPKNSTTEYQQFSVYGNLAQIYLETGDAGKALVYLKKAESICKKKLINTKEVAFSKEEITLIINLAETYIALHNTYSAAIKCKEAEDSLLNNKDSVLSSHVFAAKAHIYTAKKQFAKAIQLSIQSLKSTNNPFGTDNAYEGTKTSLGLLYCETGQFKLADSIFKSQVSQFRKWGLEGCYQFQQAYIALCKNLIFQQKYDEAFDSLLALSKTAETAISKNFAGMSEAEQLQFSAGFDVMFDMFLTLLTKKGSITQNVLKQMYALELQRKNLVLTNQAALLNRIRDTDDTSSVKLFSALLNTRQLVAKQYSLPVSERFLNTDSLEEISNGLEKQVSAKGLPTGFKTSSEIIGSFRSQDESSANIEFVKYHYVTRNIDKDSAAYAAFVFKGGDTLPSFVPLCSEKAIVNLLQDEHGKALDEEQLSKKLYAPGSNGAAALYRLVWQPLEKYLVGVTAINYSPAGLLNNISFHALNNTNGYLMGSYTMRRFFSLVGATDKDTSVMPQAASLWGNMNYDTSNYITDTANKNSLAANNTFSLTASDIKPLAQSKSISKEPIPAFATDELTPIEKIFSANKITCSSYAGLDATEENFKSHAPAIKGVLHISTHGFYTPFDKTSSPRLSPVNTIAINANPLFRCGLAFAGVNYYWMKGEPKPNHEDGILTGYEAAQLDLRNVQLVTLSACETGLGDVTANEGNLGMQRAFKLAGAKKLLVSLWKVNAKQTGELLTKFYTYWLKGNSQSKALQLAETDIQKVHPEPYYWAGFVLVE